ncbi:MAG TPA: FxDxF family PEP-CTERM protein, partial [Phenylobacterium sp.]
MKKAVLAATVAVAMLGAVSAANAAQTITLAPPAADGSFTGKYGDSGIAAGAFTDTFTFTMPTGLAGADITTEFNTDISNNIDFGTVTFNGKPFDMTPNGQHEGGFILNLPVTSGTQTLVVNGTSGGNGSFAGTLSFEMASAVPEPAAWALMIMGF